MRVLSLLIVLLVLIAGGPRPVHAQAADSTATCAQGTAEAFLDVGNVRAKVLNNGNLFWNRGGNVYEAPKGGGVQALFSASLLVTALVDGELRATTSQYDSNEYWPGPVGTTDCLSADRIWEFKDGQPVDPEWPIGRRRPDQLGDQMLYWTMNDMAGPHDYSDTTGVGLEVTGSAFAFEAAGFVGNTTFYRYQLRNVSPDTLRDVHIGMFVDADLGAAFDDFTGTDSTLGLGYFYNADDDDDGNYGPAPPAIGSVVLKRPYSTVLLGDASCRLPNPSGRGYTNHMMISKSGGGIGDGRNGLEYHHMMRSRDRNGMPLFVGRDVYDSRDTVRTSNEPFTRYGFSGDPVTGSYWSMMNYDGSGQQYAPNDTRAVGSAGPVCLGPGDETEIVFAFIWSRGSSNLDSVRQLRDDTAYILSIEDFLLTPRPQPESEHPAFSSLPFAAAVYPNPAGSDGAVVRLSIPETMGTRVEVYDLLGRHVHVAAGEAIRSAGDHQWTLPTDGWAPGVYLVRIQAGPAITTKRLIVT